MNIPQVHSNYTLRTSDRGWWRSSHQNADEELFSYATVDQTNCIVDTELNDTLATSLYSKLYNARDEGAKKFLDGQGPEGLVLDSYKYWNKNSKTINVTPDKYWWHYLLSKLDNHLLQKVTNDKIGYSYLAANATLSIVEKLVKKHGDDLGDMLKNLNEELKQGQAPSDQDLLNDIKKAANSAQNSIKKNIDGLEKSKLASKCNSETSLKFIDLATDPRLKKLTSIKSGDLDKFLKTTIDRATQTVTGKYSTSEESIFDVDEIEDLINVEAFAHVALVIDAMVKEKKYHLSFDIYIDDSGSMDSRVHGIGKSVSYRDLARMVAFKLFSLGILRDVYLFSCRDNVCKIKHEHIFSAHIGGGTDIQQCISLAKKHRRPTILITDGWDNIKSGPDGYFQDMFILILQCHSTSSTFKQYLPKKQLMFYNNGIFQEGVLDNSSEQIMAK